MTTTVELGDCPGGNPEGAGCDHGSLECGRLRALRVEGGSGVDIGDEVLRCSSLVDGAKIELEWIGAPGCW